MKCGCATCFYCDGPLSVRHEHDHMPVPKRHGGIETVASCINCHDLKDRMALNNWQPSIIGAALAEAGPLGRILLAKLSALIEDVKAATARESERAEEPADRLLRKGEAIRPEATS